MRRRTFGLMLVIGLVVAACGGDTGAEETTTTAAAEDPTTTAAPDEPTTTAATGTTEGDDTGTTAPAATDGVHVVDSEFGEILVDPEGFTLYIFTQDTGGESVCYDQCAELWPPVEASTPISGDLDAAMFGSAPRTDGTEQLTVNGMPLYLYTPDANPGDVTGQGFNDVWFVVDPSGNMIEAAAATDVPVDFDYDY